MTPETYSPYCPKCESCGENGCCSWVSCFASHIQDDNCHYGESYLKDARFANIMSNFAIGMIQDLEEGKIKPEELAPLFNDTYDKSWDKIYNPK